MTKRRIFAVLTGGLLALTALPYVFYLALYRLLSPEGSPADKRPAEPTVSIVLPTYNEERIVEKKLADVLALDYPMEKVELVIVDSSEDATPDIIQEYFHGREVPELNLIEETERQGVAAALNKAYDAASKEVIFRTDCDSSLESDVLRGAAANLADPDVSAVTGRQTEVLGDSQVETDYRNVQGEIQALESHLDSTFIFHGPCFAFEAEYYEPLDTQSLADDTEVAVGIRRRGQRVIVDPALRFMESGVSDFRKRRKRKDRRAMGLVELLVRNRDMLGRYERYGRIVLPFNWWFMIVSPVLMAVSLLLIAALALLTIGTGGLVIPIGLGLFIWLGQKDRLGRAQPLYMLFDTQVSLLVAILTLLRGDADGTWQIDRESREAFE